MVMLSSNKVEWSLVYPNDGLSVGLYLLLPFESMMGIVGVMSGGGGGCHARGSPLVFAHGFSSDMRWYYIGEGGRVPSLVMAEE